VIKNKLAAALATMYCASGWAQTNQPGVQVGPTVKVTGGASYGLGVRLSDPAPTLLFGNNARQSDLSTTNTAGRNQDDGNMNYRKGDLYANLATAFVDLRLATGSFSGLMRAQAWYDQELKSGGVPWGHSPNGFQAGAPLSDARARPRGKFANAILSEVWVRNRFEVSDVPVDITAGNQTIGWRGNGLLPGSMAGIDPADAMGRNRPGAFAEQTTIPFPAIRASFKTGNGWSVDSFYQLGFRANQAPVCGTFFSVADRGEDGCDLTMVNAGAGTLSDRELLAAGRTLKLTSTEQPSGGTQLGFKLQWTGGPVSEIGLSYARVHSRTAYMNLVKSQIPGANPFAPNDPRNPQTQTVYPQGVETIALDFRQELAGTAVYGSLAYSPNRPIGYPAGEVVQTFAAAVANASLFRAQERAIAPGGVFEAWDRRHTSEWQLGVTHTMKNMLAASIITLRGELNARRVENLPDPSQTRYQRPEVFGIGPINGVCPAGTSATACSNDGYVSPSAWGYALQAVATYPQAVGAVTLRPRLGFAHNVEGYSFDGALKEGRKTVSLGLDALYGNATFSLAWLHQTGSVYDNAIDRNYATASASLRF
jgi:Protein of unknown function (DUF1302)